MKEIQVLIIEDEIPTQRMLVEMIQSVRPEWDIIHKCGSVSDSVDFLTDESNKSPDLIFADIQLSDGISFDIFSQVKVECPVIFTTAYDEYAIQAFKVNSIDYLLKPIKLEMLKKSIAKFEHRYPIDRPTAEAFLFETIKEAIQTGQKKYRSRFLIQHGEDFIKLETDQIALIYSVNKITFAKTFDGREHVLDLTLEKLERQLDPEVFFRINRQAIVHAKAIKKIRTYFNGRLKLITNPLFQEDLIVSRDKARILKDWLDR